MLFAGSTTYPQLVAVLIEKATYLKTLVDELSPSGPWLSEIGEMLLLAPCIRDPWAGFSFSRMNSPQQPSRQFERVMFLNGMVIWVSKGPAHIKDDGLSCL